jgi:hypothetical protein
VADFDKCHNLSKRNVKRILKILSDLEPLRGSSNKKTLYSTRSCVNWALSGMSGPRPHMNLLNKLLYCGITKIAKFYSSQKINIHNLDAGFILLDKEHNFSCLVCLMFIFCWM